MFDTIVVPLEPTGHREPVLHVADTLAQQAGAALELLTVIPTDADPDEARTRLATVTGYHRLHARIQVWRADDVGLALADMASQPGVLMCMASHARRPLGDLVVGSVSERVVREARQPVLLVGPNCRTAPARFASMVVGLDGSDLAETALPLAADWATHLGLTPWLYQVLPARVPLEVGAGDVSETSYLHRTAAHLAVPGSQVEWDVCHDGHTAAAITRFATGLPGALIAMSTHGRSGLGRLAMGGVALAVARQATVPVLVTRPHPARDGR